MNLVPEKRTDKNGITRTRWVRPTTSKDTSSVLPQPQIAPVAQSSTSNEELVDLMIAQRFPNGIHTSKIDDISIALDMIRNDDPSIIALAEEFMTSGSSRARSIAAEHLYGSTLGIIEALDRTKNGWQTQCAWGDELKSVLVSGWSLGSVIDESGIPVEDEDEEFDTVDYIKGLHGELSDDSRELYVRQDHAYWRGIALLALTDRSIPQRVSPDNGTALRFIEWAGARDDVRAIVELVTERETFDPDHLSAVMNEKAATSAPLRGGTL